jgi:hypothetical protein
MMTESPIGPFLRSSSHETVIDTFLELLAQRMVALERAAGAEEIRLLRAENSRLRERLAEWESPPLDHLVTFLPAIFRNFWGQVRPEEVAMFAGSAEIPVIPSPCPELSRDELEARKRRLLQLPLDELMKVLIACRRLQQSYRLELRPELAPFMRMLP